MRRLLAALLFFTVFVAVTAAVRADAVSLESLLDEMTDRDDLCEWPSPEYTCRQASSYDRAAVSPSENWFANGDCSKFLRTEENNGRKEWVLMDAAGPGAIIRFWITAPNYVNNLYFYIDGATEPVVAGTSESVIGGDALVGAPLSQETARGRNLYLPIPYAKSVKVTCDKIDEQPAFYYQINYRTYPAGTPVESFSKQALADEADEIAEVNAELSSYKNTNDGEEQTVTVSIPAGSSTGPLDFYGPGKFVELAGKLTADDLPAALRGVVVSIQFDGEETVRCPFGDFFGGGVGVNPYFTRYTRVESDGTMTCSWPMPFQKSARIELFNYAKEPVSVTGRFRFKRDEWTDRSMYFHCNWRQRRGIETVKGNGTCDWNYLTAGGRGVYVGDALSLVNRDPAWWGEGDEKIYVDGEKFPSHFGTGTEDYYGYAWGTPTFFESPWRAQPRAEGPASYGNITNLRFRALDAIPFTKDFKIDIEVWHWAATTVDYSVASYWYAFSGAETPEMPGASEIQSEAAAGVSYRTPYELKLDGYEFAADNPPISGHVASQAMEIFGSDWKDNKQLFWIDGKPGEKIGLLFDVEKENPSILRLGMTAARDYGIVQVWLDGERLGAPLDLFHADKVIRRTQVFGALPPLSAGKHRIDFEIVGKNEKSVNYFFGTDSVVFE